MLYVWRSRRIRDDRGAAAVEFALIMLPLIYLIFGIVQYGLYFYSTQAGTSAVSDAVRRMSVGDCQDPNDLKAFLSQHLGAATTAAAGDLQPEVVYTSGVGVAMAVPGEVGGSVKLTLTFPSMNMHFPLIPMLNHGDVTKSVFARIEDTTVSAQGCS